MCRKDFFCRIGCVVFLVAIFLSGIAWFRHGPSPSDNETPYQEIQQGILRPRSILWYRIERRLTTTTSNTPVPSSTVYPPSFNVNMTDSDGNTALHRVTGDEAAMRELIHLGADINAKNNRKETALHIAADETRRTCGNKTVTHCLCVINFLISEGADVYANDREGNTFLHILFRLELSTNATTVTYTPTTLTPAQLHQIAIDYGHLFNGRNKNGESVLALALLWVKFDVYTLSLLHQKVVDFKLIDNHGRTVLVDAVRGYQSVSVLSKLIELGTDHRQLDKDEWSLLHYGSYSGNSDAVASFIKKGGLDINGKTILGLTPLHLVSGTTSTISRILGPFYSVINFGAEETDTDNRGRTTNDWIKNSRPLEVVRLLLKNGADKTIRDNYKDTPYDWVKRNKNFPDREEVLKLLG